MSNLKQVTDDTFEAEVLANDKPVLVDFWAEWCAPCRQLTPILEEIASEQGENLKIVKLNSDENPNVAREYNVMQLPNLNLFVNGEVVKQVIGAKPKALLMKELRDHI